MLMFTLGTGCGGGAVLDGKLYRGWAEFGHIVIEVDGLPCQGFCHGRGHLEPYVTGVAATRIAQELFGPAADSYRLVRLANEGDEQAREALAGIGHKLGAGIASLCNVFGIELRRHRRRLRRRRLRLARSGGARDGEARRARRRGRDAPDRARRAGDDGRPVGRRAARVRSALMLSVCATPIGNLEDVTLRVLRELREADVVLCEDTRHTRVLLERHDIRAKLLSYHEHNEAKRTAELLPRLLAGERVALVSDAGMPGISDPGARLIAAALDAGVQVTVLPGRVGGRDRARCERARRRALPVHRLPAARREGAGVALARARALAVAGRRLRVAPAAAAVAALAGRRARRRGRSRSAAS